jgi:hypothetical protein
MATFARVHAPTTGSQPPRYEVRGSWGRKGEERGRLRLRALRCLPDGHGMKGSTLVSDWPSNNVLVPEEGRWVTCGLSTRQARVRLIAWNLDP